jgi:uncharacterized ferritin-like protein (DUF455 family)
MTRAADRDWAPFQVCDEGAKPDRMRGLGSVEGIGDRLRTAAFQERMARDAFVWAEEGFSDASDGLRKAWRALISAESKHLGWLMQRMADLGVDPGERLVSAGLWRALVACSTAREFALIMARAEERGRVAGEHLHASLVDVDPDSAVIFGRIAEEEVEHIELAHRFFPPPR